MPAGPKGQRRPTYAVECAVKVTQNATGEIGEMSVSKSGRIRSGRAGAKVRAQNLSPKGRSEIARLAAEVRWKDGS